MTTPSEMILLGVEKASEFLKHVGFAPFLNGLGKDIGGEHSRGFRALSRCIIVNTGNDLSRVVKACDVVVEVSKLFPKDLRFEINAVDENVKIGNLISANAFAHDAVGANGVLYSATRVVTSNKIFGLAVIICTATKINLISPEDILSDYAMARASGHMWGGVFSTSAHPRLHCDSAESRRIFSTGATIEEVFALCTHWLCYNCALKMTQCDKCASECRTFPDYKQTPVDRNDDVVRFLKF